MDRDYVVRTRVQNQAIVREVDEHRQRELFGLVWLGVLVLCCVLFTAWQHHVHRRLEKRQAELATERARALEARRHLQLELASLSAPGRIERIAVRQLKMQAPDRQTSAIVERVTTAPAPASSIVAAAR